MEYEGYMGKMLHVDLTNRETREENLDPNFARKYVGCFGMGARR
jgi:aldehyde:ferredoxin oxidoreductase